MHLKLPLIMLNARFVVKYAKTKSAKSGSLLILRLS